MHNLEGDFGALIAPGLELAFEERHESVIDGLTITGESVRRVLPVCGPAAFLVLKAFALADRGEPKDSYDLLYVLRHWPGGVGDVAERLAAHAVGHPDVVADALGKLADDYRTPDSLGPQRAVAFEGSMITDQDAAAADAHGHVDDLLRACRRRGLSIASPSALGAG